MSHRSPVKNLEQKKQLSFKPYLKEIPKELPKEQEHVVNFLKNHRMHKKWRHYEQKLAETMESRMRTATQR